MGQWLIRQLSRRLFASDVKQEERFDEGDDDNNPQGQLGTYIDIINALDKKMQHRHCVPAALCAKRAALPHRAHAVMYALWLECGSPRASPTL